ncbi:hypothetical protein EDC01DRAFT_751570 [Geopyxis carbonaria]|nr:hypothetical protein EDC01DRAFT_751570 [Geopyxis carbonaria]
MAKPNGSNAPIRYNTFLCIGSGMAGIALAGKLHQIYGSSLGSLGSDVHFYEKADGMGGTWYKNQYPGCACDVPSALYSFSFDPFMDASCLLPKQQETLAYIQRVAEKHSVPQRTSFRTLVYKCEWRTDTQLWRVYLKDLNTGEKYEHECKVLFGATGVLDTPRESGIEGQENFKGVVMHSSQWDSNVELEGKKIIVVGNGCTGAQIIPGLLERNVASIAQFFRSKHWIQPTLSSRKIPTSLIWIFQHIPGVHTLWRFLFFLLLEQTFGLFYENPLSLLYRRFQQYQAQKYLEERVPEKYHKLLIPDFDFACKRRILEPPDYLNSLSSPRVSLHSDLIAAFTPTGIRTTDGQEFSADIVALCTGFKTNEFMYSIETLGENGESLTEHWSKLGGPSAYNTTAVSGFPNFFIILGPNSTSGHMSVLLAIECNIDFALRTLKPVLDGTAMSVTAKPEAERRFVAGVQDALTHRVWNHGCGSWYYRGGWNGMMWPWSSGYLWWISAVIHWSDLDVKYKEKPRSIIKNISLLALLVLVTAFWMSQGNGKQVFDIGKTVAETINKTWEF